MGALCALFVRLPSILRARTTAMMSANATSAGFSRGCVRVCGQGDGLLNLIRAGPATDSSTNRVSAPHLKQRHTLEFGSRRSSQKAKILACADNEINSSASDHQ